MQKIFLPSLYFSPIALYAATSSVATSAQEVIWTGKDVAASESSSWLLIGFGALLLIVAGYILVRANDPAPSEADEYAIIEDIIIGKDEK